MIESELNVDQPRVWSPSGHFPIFIRDNTIRHRRNRE
jgi:hypothetical protein